VNSQRPIHQRDSGAALILAIGFVLAIGAISAGLAALATSSLTDRTTLEQVRDREYAADGVMEKAIAQARGFDCATVTTPIRESFNQVAIWVDVTNACGSPILSSDGVTPYNQRNVIFSACLDASVVCTPATTIIRAQVNFEPSSGSVIKTYIQSWNVNK
jgi:hypothetical protein